MADADHDRPADPRTRHAAHGSVGSLTTGFALSVVLTAIPFAAVMFPVLPRWAILTVVVAAALAQICVQMYYFLHFNRGTERWNVISFVFTIVIIGTLVVGSLWIMAHLSHNVIGEGSPHDAMERFQ